MRIALLNCVNICSLRSIHRRRFRKVCLFPLIAILLVPPQSVHAFETDQYNLPPQPLADIGNEVSEHVEAKLRKAVAKANTEIVVREKCLAATSDNGERKGCGPQAAERVKLEDLRSEDGIAREVFEKLGGGVPPFTSMGTWMDSHRFVAQPARYRTSYWKSIFILNPIIALTISPTVNLYGSEFGTDKIAHIFQQGYTYYKMYRRALAEGATPLEARERAVGWGQKSERTFYGTLVGGVDFANYFLVLKEGATPGPYATLAAVKAAGGVAVGVIALAIAVWMLLQRGSSRRPLAAAD